MLKTVLHSKLHRIVATHADLNYEGSIAIDRTWLNIAGIQEYEKVLVANADNGNRFETYAVEAPIGSKVVCVNGAAAHLVSPGHKLIVMSFCQLEPRLIQAHKPVILLFSEDNTFKIKCDLS